MSRLLATAAAATAALVLGAGPPSVVRGAAGQPAEVVVLLDAPPLAHAPGSDYAIAAQQREFRRELAARLPEARIRWRYRLVANGFSLTLPSTRVPQLRTIAGVRDVYGAARYGPQLDRTPQQIGTAATWGPGLETAGQGTKIGIIDSGVDQTHTFFDPAGYAMPPGFPKGQRRFTTAKVIVARSFPPPGTKQPSARLAFDPDDSSHGTHVAGIAAGNAQTRATGNRIVSGVAPRAYIGNYKVFVETDSGVSPNANSPAIVAAIEAAVADGMDVINFSGGEPEIAPSRDLVALALDAAAAAGVVPVIAAGNDYNDVGAGSVSSPANSIRAISVGAVEMRGEAGAASSGVHAGFSSVGPTTISLRLKPDVAAPGVDVFSSVVGGWSSISGTSMAAPHVAGAAALLRQRHPEWTVEELKSALVQTGRDVALTSTSTASAGPTFVGGGLVWLPAADQPLVFAEPSAISLGLVGRGADSGGVIRLRDAGGGAGTWNVTVETGPPSPSGISLEAPPTVVVPGELPYRVLTTNSPEEGEFSAFIRLWPVAATETGARRIPVWGRVAVAALGRHTPRELTRGGAYRSSTAGQPALVSRYRYPDDPRGIGVATVLLGPERVYRIRLTKRVANFGVVVTQRGPASRVEPRVVAQLDENRLTGYAGLPVSHNPYLEDFQSSVLAAGALSPVPGEYAVVFDSATRAGAGAFTFRYWVDDVTPPTLRVRTAAVVRGRPLRVAATDAGSGVYPDSVLATIDGSVVSATFRDGVVRIATSGLSTGKHRLRLRVSDYQETKNTENVARILPNTRTLVATVTIRR